MRVSRTIIYGIQATLELARQDTDRPVPCGELAEHGHMPQRYLLQVLRQLVKSGVLRSIRGVEGGYCLNRAPASITLLEIVHSLESPTELTRPDLELLSPRLREALSATLQQSDEMMRKELQKITLADLIDSPIEYPNRRE